MAAICGSTLLLMQVPCGLRLPPALLLLPLLPLLHLMHLLHLLQLLQLLHER